MMGNVQHSQSFAAPARTGAALHQESVDADDLYTTNHSSRHSQAPSLPNHQEAKTVQNSLRNNDRRDRGDSRNTSSAPAPVKCKNQAFLTKHAQKLTAKEGHDITGMSEKAFENVRQGRNKISFDSLTEWARRDPTFRAALFQYWGGKLQFPPEITGMLAKVASWQENENAVRGME